MQETDQVLEWLPVSSRDRCSAAYFYVTYLLLALGYFLILKQNSLEIQIYYLVRNTWLPIKAGVNK